MVSLVEVVVVMVTVVVMVVRMMVMRHPHHLTSLHARFVREPWINVAKPRPSDRDLTLSARHQIKAPVLAVAQDHVVTVRDLAAGEARIPRLEFMIVAATVAETEG